jgi:transposase
MRSGVDVRLEPGDRERLEAVLAERNSAQKHAWRARIILATAEGCGTAEIVRRAGVSKPCVCRRQRRFMEAGIGGLLRDRTRRPGKAPVPEPSVTRLIERTLGGPPGETTHWTSRAMAKATGLAISTVQKIWRAHGLAPHRLRTFKLSRDPRFAAKVRDVVGLYVAPPAHAVVLSVDEKPQIQALDRTQPGLPVKPGRCATMTHDYERHGTTTLFAALNVLDSTVLGRCMQRHRHQEFLRFLNAVEAAVPASKLVHAILDNHAAHKHPKVLGWLARHPRWTFHFTPTSAPWLNAVETFFANLTRQRLKRGSVASLVALREAINRFVAERNRDPRPFVWTADPDAIIAPASRGHQALASIP